MRGYPGCVMTGEHRDRGDDARGPVSDEFPCPRDSDDQQSNEEIADELCSAGAVRIQDEINTAGELQYERQQKEGDQSDLPRHMAPWQMTGEDGSRPRSGIEDADDSQHGGRVPDVVPGYQAEQRDRQRISERQDRGGRADLLDDDRAIRWVMAGSDGHGNEQQAGKRGRAVSDRREQIPVGPG